MKFKRGKNYIEKVSNGFEVAVAVLMLVVIAMKLLEFTLYLAGVDVVIFQLEFVRILSITLSFVIGVEFVKMLCKHTVDSVIDVLLFTIARQMVVYHETMLDILIGVGAIAGMFATRKFFVDKKLDKFDDEDKST